MNSITLVTLKNCSLCRELREELDRNDIRYKLIEAENNSTYCDKLEESLKISNYPIAFVEDNKYFYYYYLVSNYNDIKVDKISPKAYLVGCYSIVDMIDNLLN